VHHPPRPGRVIIQVCIRGKVTEIYFIKYAFKPKIDENFEILIADLVGMHIKYISVMHILAKINKNYDRW